MQMTCISQFVQEYGCAGVRCRYGTVWCRYGTVVQVYGCAGVWCSCGLGVKIQECSQNICRQHLLLRTMQQNMQLFLLHWVQQEILLADA